MTAILVIIYVSFISLGLPDGILGAAWPVMSVDLGAPISFAGVISMLIFGGTIVSSLFSEKVIRRFGTGLVTSVSVLMTALALLGFALSSGVVWLCIFAIPLGLGAGSVDAALNNFIAVHYKARHMNWLHCFWGVGASAGPLIISAFIYRQSGWKIGYGIISIAQIILVAALFVALPLWKKAEHGDDEQSHQHEHGLLSSLKTPGVKSAMLIFFAYGAMETTTGLWGSTYLVGVKGLSPEAAAQWVSLFYLGITAGRFISGFISFKLKNTAMIRMGMVIIAAGLLAMLVPSGSTMSLVGFVLIGLGCAPVFPGMMHETPERFGKLASQKIVGLQMASAYAGTTFMPPLFGAIAQYIDFSLFPFFLLLMFFVSFGLSENLNRVMLRKKISAFKG